MSSPVVNATVNFLPTALGQTATLGPDTTAGVKMVCYDRTNLPAGAVITVSTQKIQSSGGVYVETDSSGILSNIVAVPAAPGAGYQPQGETEPEASPFGYQAVITFVSGTLPTVAIAFTLESL